MHREKYPGTESPDEYKETNRQRAQHATKEKFWCPRCDLAIVGEYGKCRICGWKSEEKRK
jgi:hypothetical protein